MNSSKKKSSVVKIIVVDIIKYQKLAFALLFLVIVSCAIVINLTHKVHLQLIEKSELVLEKDALETEWNSLILEENTLTSNKLVEHKAKMLGMEYISSKNEIVIKVEH